MIGLVVNIENLCWSSYLINLKRNPVSEFPFTKLEGRKTSSCKYGNSLEQTHNQRERGGAGVRKNQMFFPCSVFLVSQVITYRSDLIPRKFPCPKKFLVTRPWSMFQDSVFYVISSFFISQFVCFSCFFCYVYKIVKILESAVTVMT